MSKPPPEKKREDIDLKELDDEEDEEDIDGLEDISDEELLNEPLDDELDPEIISILNQPLKSEEASSPTSVKSNITSSTKITSSGKESIRKEEKIASLQQASIKPINQGKKTTQAVKPIPAAVIRQFTLFLIEKAKYYEEISFDTILRKIPPAWDIREESVLIDLIEKILEHGLLQGKITAHSLKFIGDSKIDKSQSSDK
jgi:hypothetical protein